MARPSNLAQYYQQLELPTNATVQQVKEAYRRLAKQYHPDLNPGDRWAAEQFLRIQQAYEMLITALEQAGTHSTHDRSDQEQEQASPRSTRVKVHVKKSADRATSSAAAKLSPDQERLKQRVLSQIHRLLRHQQWQQAIYYAEDLAARFPQQPDVCRMLAKAYHGRALYLIDRRKYEEARPYLQKASKTDRHNRQLWQDINRAYQRIERGMGL
ncbi:J domain-containing protein [Thermocoleostomius sinensis]|jgi:curved DNA-binding protein CbpA|uniref:DnaJ domain-containing protein n=1 Tax=Thermocoleostomius sinensis A174 TaxID=2016057 RepID=A0A9E9CBP4_9CYAN|nr:DnaJ domain-containing protein [Thermocoleostomius sinensis]WAL62732.1 DnaJ domain-containing protein [Thermocoleostomius sinensis A174]